MKLNEAFFAKEGEKGLTETSAAHLCALASQRKKEAEALVHNVDFVNAEVSIVGLSEKNPIRVGYTEEQLQELSEALKTIMRMNEFIAWFAEARKNLEGVRRELSRMDFEDWLEETHQEFSEKPIREKSVELSTLEDVKNDMSIKDYNTYLTLEARASSLGQFIHPEGDLEKARDFAHNIRRKPYEVKGQGRDTLIYRYWNSIPNTTIDSLYNTLEKEYRSVQQNLNHMKSDLRKELSRRNSEEEAIQRVREAEYAEKLEKWQHEKLNLIQSYNEWLRSEKERLSKIRFALPKALEPTMIELNNL